MNDRWITLAGALGALLILFALLYSPAQTLPVSRPTLEESGPNGYLALDYWLHDSAVDVRSHRLRLDQLHQQQGLPGAGNVLITTMPHAKPLRAGELAAVRQWLASGNTLLVMAALDDTPDWILSTPAADFPQELRDLTGLSFTEALDAEGETILVGSVLAEHRHTFKALTAHPLMAGVETLTAVSDSFTSVWNAQLGETGGFMLSLAFDAEHAVDALWEIPAGEGRVLLSASSSLLTNRVLGEAGNARFLANLLAWHLGPGGAVIFDDFHQGLSQLYDPEDFFADPRLHRTLWFIVGFWLLYLLGASARLAPPRQPLIVSHQADLVAATGGLMSRKLSSGEAGRAMVDAWLQELARAGHLPSARATLAGTGNVPWGFLAALPFVDPEVLQAIRDSHTRLGRGKKIDLAELHNNILKMKRDMA